MKYEQMIDHTYLKPEGTSREIDKLISEALEYNFKSICINSSWVKYAKEKIQKNNLLITSVIGFPLGAMSTQAKVFEAKLAIDHGADEIDMVMNIGRFKEKQFDYVLNEIKKIKEVIGNKVLKVIIETALLTEKEIEEATEIVLKSGANFIKTSTGFSYRGASLEDIQIMKKIIGNQELEIKAAGGIKSFADLESFYKAGATRFGTSASIKILNNEVLKKEGY